MLNRIRDLIDLNVDFAFETTLATKSYLPFLKEAKDLGYNVVLVFFWLNSVELAKTRVKERVAKGGHNIPEEVIERRYERGIKNLSKFIGVCDEWIVCDNSLGTAIIIAEGTLLIDSKVYNFDVWKKIGITS